MIHEFKQVAILDWNFLAPSEFISSDEIEQSLHPLYKRLSLPPGRLELMTGIKQRGLFPREEVPSLWAANAAKPIVDEHRDELDLLIYAGVSKDCLEPSTASRVHHLLKLNARVMNFDLSNACLGFMSATLMAAHLIEKGIMRKALICAGENARPLLEETIRRLNTESIWNRQNSKKIFASLTIGSGAAAWVVGKPKEQDTKPYFSLGLAHAAADTDATYLCQGEQSAQGLWMETDSEELLKAGIKLAGDQWSHFKTKTKNTADHIFMHQVGRAHVDALTKNLLLDEHKLFNIYEEFGNMGPVALPASFILAQRKNKLKQGDHCFMMGIGSGLNSLMLQGRYITKN
jgi:3-oxoacyl-[acyl-carrier-protein] synthase-3